MTKRLTEQDHMYRSISEKEFQAQVLSLASILGWHSMHVRHAPEVTKRDSGIRIARYTTPTLGSMGKGWPDLVLVHQHSGRIIFAELKSEIGQTSEEQDRVLAILRNTTADVFVWRPSDIESIERVLRRV